MNAAIWALDPAGESPPRRLTRSAPGETVGAFLRDGSLLFTSTRPDPDRPKDEEEDDEAGRLWLLPATGGEARVLIGPSGGVEDVRAARDADVVVFSATVFPGTTSLAGDRDRHKARTKAGVEALLFEGYPIRRWDHYLGPRERHLFRAALPPGEERIAEPVDLTPDAGQALLETAYDVTPDGSTTVTAWSVTTELTRLHERLVAIDATSRDRRFLSPDDGHWYSEPACSPDGRWVVATRQAPGSPERVGDQTLWLVDLRSGEGRDLTPDVDLWPHAPAWTPDSEAILFTADRQGGAAVLRVELATGEATVLADEGAFTDLAPTPDGKRAFAILSSYAAPPQVVRLEASAQAGAEARGQQPVPIGSFPELAAFELPGTVERLAARASDGVEVPSWLVLPREASSEAPVPLVVWVHGGPLASWNSWHWRWNPHLLAAAGYAVLLPDPALSTGYGIDYIQRGWGRWGEEPYTDVMAAVDAALERPDLDVDRTALMGGSFGGYMANWVAGQTDRFRAIVTHASLWELRGFHGTTDLGPEWEREFGDPYADASRYESASPHRLVDRITTPLLVIHGEKDHRVPISEALRLWTDLSRHGVEAKFLYFPDENHWVLKPQNARLWYETVIAFLDQHVRGQEWRRPSLI